MQVSSPALIVILAISAGISYAQPAPAGAAQAPPAATKSAAVEGQEQAATSAPATAATPAATATSILQPSLTRTQTMLSSLKVDKWKKGSVRDEAGENVNALLHDLQTNLPPLMTAADAEPGALSRAIPLMKHLDAFYDVLLRVEEASRVSAPSEQISSLQQTLLDVNKARIAYDDQLQTQAASQEKQVFDLRTELQAQKDATAAEHAKVTAAAAAQTTTCKPAATPARKKKRSTSSSKSSSGTKSDSTTPTTPAKPQ